MFESSFRRIAKFSAKHSTGVIIAWVLILIMVAPSSTLFLSNTSYDLGGSIVPANSQAQVASNLQSKYFSSTEGPGSNGSALIIVSTNTNVSTSSGAEGMLSLQENLTNYLKTVNGYENITTAFTLENSTLTGYANGLKEELNATYGLISSINSEMNGLNGSIIGETNSIYYIPSKFLGYINESQSSSQAYNNTILFIETYTPKQTQNMSLLYLQSFYNYWNAKFNPVGITDVTGYASSTMSLAIYQALHNYTSPYHNLIESLNGTTLLYTIYDQYPFVNFLNKVSELPYLKNITISVIQQGLAGNSTLGSFFNNTLNINEHEFLDSVYSLGLPATPVEMSHKSRTLVLNGTIASLNGNPEITCNPSSLQGFLKELNNSKNATSVARTFIHAGSFSNYPIIPTEFVFHQFVGYKNSTTIMIASFSQNYSLTVVNKVTDIANNYSSKQLPSSNFYVAGTSALDQQLNTEILSGMVRALAIGILLSVIIVGLFFRSPIAAFLPLSIFGFSTVLSMGINGLLYKYVFHASISFITPTLLLILLLGLTSDYVVYIMSRYRQERRRQNPAAIFDTGQWAGHAVFTSGITVTLSYLVLWVSNIPIFSDSGLTNAIGVAVSIALANTFLIAILQKAGIKLYWPSNITHANKFPLEKSMGKISSVVKNNRKKILVVFLVVSFFASYVYISTPTSMNVFDLVPSSSGIKALEVVNNSFNGDFFDRGFIVLNFTSPLIVNGVYNTTEINEITAVENSLISKGEITQVYGPTFPYGSCVPINLSGIPSGYYSTYRNQSDSYISSHSNYATITFQLASVSWRNQASEFVSSMPGIINSAITGSSTTQPSNVQYNIGGLTQSLNDAHSYTQSTFTKIVPILLIAIFVILLIQLSSLFTPARLIAMVMSSVLVALSFVFLLLFYGRGEPILIFLPLFTFITLMAVGLDYDIFMVTRVREEVLRGKDDEEATLISIKENGGVIVTLGMLLFVTFGALYISGIGIMEEIGLGLALGVLVDTFISWPFFVPSIMMLLKKWNWWPSKMKIKED